MSQDLSAYRIKLIQEVRGYLSSSILNYPIVSVDEARERKIFATLKKIRSVEKSMGMWK